tara:strand:+ start:236 stop:439 length:204 start_codon:yes stop_codon:yes gene_type:complete
MIKSKAQNIIFKFIKKKVSNNNDLKIKITDKIDSLKFMELLVELEKNAKKKFNPSKVKTLKDINDLF